MKILVCGTRGIPNILGGVETHCEALYPRLSILGVNIVVIRRTKYVPQDGVFNYYKGVKLVDLWSVKNKYFEAFLHTATAIFYAKVKGYKYIHIHSIGSSLLIPLARILGTKVVMTHHGPDYERQKWGKVEKAFLKLGEWCAAKYANEIIVISNTINNILKDRYNRTDAHLIYNGVDLPVPARDNDYIKSLDLEPKKYVIAVGRFVPEKGFHDLITAFNKIETNYKLVLVGDADYETNYSRALKKQARESGIILTGFIKGQKLNQIFTNAALFVMPSYHEGLPIALLEAMSYNLNILTSDIPANMEVKLNASNYFKCGDINDLSKKLQNKIKISGEENYIQIIKNQYNWDIIAKQTVDVYHKLMNNA